MRRKINYHLLIILVIVACFFCTLSCTKATKIDEGFPLKEKASQGDFKRGRSHFPYIQFCGAAQMVGGSCYLIDTGKTRLLIDFGLYYGEEYQHKNSVIEFDPSSISYVLLTHAHVDHCGKIPMLYKYGFKGKVLGTDATKDITRVMLDMSLSIGKDQGTAIYEREDLYQAMNNFVEVPYDQIVEISGDVSVRFREAGHILGSSIIELWLKDGDKTIKVVATGDMGSELTPLLRDPDIIKDGDYILVESTYGSVRRTEKDYRQFGKKIQDTISSGGSVLIPAFVLEKTQKLIYVLGQLKREGVIGSDVPVLADSSTGQKITNIYRKYTKYYDSEALTLLAANGDPLSFPFLYEMRGKESLQFHKSGKPSIYLTSSGMLDYAYAPRHLEIMIDNPNHLLAIPGWQAPGSLGRKLQEGALVVDIPIEEYTKGQRTKKYVKKNVKMEVEKFGMFSSHADGCDILRWLANVDKVKEVFVVHGEKESSFSLAENITKILGFKASVPAMGDIVYLSTDDRDYYRKADNVNCDRLNKFEDMQSYSDQ